MGINSPTHNTEDLFVSLAEQVKTPFLQIANAAELLEISEISEQQKNLKNSIKLASRSAVKLIDSYLLNVELGRQQTLDLESVSLSSAIYDVSQSIAEFAKLHNCRLELDVGGKYGPVMANNRAVFAALTSLGISFVEANAQEEHQSIIKLAVKRSATGISVGIFSPNNMSRGLLKQARVLKGRVHQPIAEFDGSPGAGVFLADELFAKMNSEMRVSTSKGMSGISAVLPLSQQLSLV